MSDFNFDKDMLRWFGHVGRLSEDQRAKLPQHKLAQHLALTENIF